MKSWVDTAASALISGTAASLAMTAALALLAKKEGKGALQPTNSTSHWLHGEEASSIRSLDVSHTGLGYGTHYVSALFWAFIFERWLATRPRRNPYSCLETQPPCRPLLPWSITASRRKDLHLDGRNFEALHRSNLCSDGARFSDGCNVDLRMVPAKFCHSTNFRLGGPTHERHRSRMGADGNCSFLYVCNVDWKPATLAAYEC